MANQPTVELIAIGNELLVGQVLDTNSHWLIRSLTALGAHVRRVQMIRDEYDEIETTFKDAFRRGPRLVVTTGGLGPTDDDLTARALARTIGVDLQEHPEALAWVRERYEHLASIRPNFNAALNDARRKMALFPIGSAPLHNPNGAAPAITLDMDAASGKILTPGAGDLTMVCLPGVPSEMKEIFATSMQTVLARTVGAGGYVERSIVLDRGDESRIADVLQEVQGRHPDVYVKSRGQVLPDYGQRLTVVLSRGGNDLGQVRSAVLACEADASRGLIALGYQITTILES